MSLQLAPSAHVTEDMREVIVRALSLADLELSEWLPLEGEATISEDTPRVAEPTLLVVFAGSTGRPAADECGAVAPNLGRALSKIRRDLPGLPLGIKVLAEAGSQWLGFRREDPPDLIERGANALTNLPSDPGAFGWEDGKRAWIPI